MTVKNSQFDFDVLVIGGGPAGLATALWCDDLGMSAVVLERQTEFGGQLLNIHAAIRNYPGLETANGREMRDVFLLQVQQRNIKLKAAAEIAETDLAELSVTDSEGSVYSAQAIVIATGVRRRRLNVEGESEFYGKGIIVSGQRDRELIKEKRLLIVGGGDAALENAALLSDEAAETTVVIRRSGPSARTEFIDKLKGNARVKFLFDSEVTAFTGGEMLSGATVKNNKSGTTDILDIDVALIRIGVEPNTEILAGAVDLDPHCYINVDHECETNLPGVFAIGDVANPISPTISTAIGTASTAAKRIFVWINHKEKL